MEKLSEASKSELQVLEDMELHRHFLSETNLRELKAHMSLELNRDYRIPEAERQRLKVRDKYSL